MPTTSKPIDAVAADDFIEVFPAAVPAADCAAWIDRFRTSDARQPGRVGSGVMPELKRSTDIMISGRPEWRDVEAALQGVVFAGLIAYVRRHPQCLLAPLMLEVPDGAGGRRRLTMDSVRTMDDAQLGAIVNGVLRPGTINLQHYLADSGGYPYWHCELYPQAGNTQALQRHLLWSVYLNDGFDAGETEFLAQARKIVPHTGDLLIAPASFTHTHRGNQPIGGDKFIATSWILFQTAERLFGHNAGHAP